MRWRGRQLRFTRQGKYFVALTFAIGFGAINTGNNLLYLVLGTMLSLIVGSGILSELTLRRVEIERREPEQVFAGQPFLVELTLRNSKRTLPSLSVELEDLQAGKPIGRKCYFLKVPAQQRQSASYRHVFARRGGVRLDEVRIKTRFPFGLFEKTRRVSVSTTLIVYPAVHPVRPTASNRWSDGGQHRGRRGRRGEIVGLRDYRDGDDLRDISWRKSARTGRMFVREHEEPAGRHLTLFIDNARLDDRDISAQEAEERQERAVSHTASLAVHYLNQGHSVALSSHTVSVASARGPGQVERILLALALIAFVDAPTQEVAVRARSNQIYVSPRHQGAQECAARAV